MKDMDITTFQYNIHTYAYTATRVTWMDKHGKMHIATKCPFNKVRKLMYRMMKDGYQLKTSISAADPSFIMKDIRIRPW